MAAFGTKNVHSGSAVFYLVNYSLEKSTVAFCEELEELIKYSVANVNKTINMI